MREHFAIFDMDGTLVNSMPFWDRVCGELLEQMDIETPVEELMDTLKPMTIAQTAEYLNARYHKTLSVRELSDGMCSVMLTHYQTDVPLKDGVVPFLDALQKSGVRMCVASSSPTRLIEACLNRLGLAGYFECMLSAETVGKGKTEPDIFLAAADAFGAEPADVVVFDDALTAGRTAQKAGFRVAAVYDEGGHAEWETFRREADYAVTDWDHALQALD